VNFLKVKRLVFLSVKFPLSDTGRMPAVAYKAPEGLWLEEMARGRERKGWSGISTPVTLRWVWGLGGVSLVPPKHPNGLEYPISTPGGAHPLTIYRIIGGQRCIFFLFRARGLVTLQSHATIPLLTAFSLVLPTDLLTNFEHLDSVYWGLNGVPSRTHK